MNGFFSFDRCLYDASSICTLLSISVKVTQIDALRQLEKKARPSCTKNISQSFLALFCALIFAMFAHPLYLLCCSPSHCMMCCCLLHCICRKGKCTKRPNRSSMNFWRGRLRCRSSQRNCTEAVCLCWASAVTWQEGRRKLKLFEETPEGQNPKTTF